MSAVDNALPQAATPEDHAAEGGSGPDKPQNLLYQQQEAQRIARQLLNRPLTQTGQMAAPPQPQQQFILQQQYHDAAARGGGPPQRMLPTYGYAYPASTFFQNQVRELSHLALFAEHSYARFSTVMNRFGIRGLLLQNI